MDKLLLYMNPPGDVRLEVLIEREMIWLTRMGIAELFGVRRAAISKHLGNIFESGELEEVSVVSILETTAADRGANCTRFLDLRAILSIGHRLKSNYATVLHLDRLALRTHFEFSTLNESIIEANG